MNTATQKQADYIKALVSKIESRKVVAPKKVSRFNDPVKAHGQHVAKARAILAELTSGAMTSGAASTAIGSLQMWAR